MPSLIDLLLLAGFVAVAGLCRPRWAFAAVLGATVLVPNVTALPYGAPDVLRAHLIAALAALAGLAWRTATGRTPTAIWRPTGPMLALAAYLLVAVIIGFGFAAAGVTVSPAVHRIVDLVQELPVLVACVALVREDGQPAGFAAPVSIVLLISVGIGLLEHATGSSWGQWLLNYDPGLGGTSAAQPLQLRAGVPRIRAGADYSVAYASVLVALLPMLLVAGVRWGGWRRIGCVVGGVATLLAVYWSGTRSAVLELAVGLLVVGLFSARRWLILTTIAVVVVAAIGIESVPQLAHHFSLNIDQGSVNSRTQRLQIVLGAVAGHPLTGLGLTSLSLVGLTGLDSTYTLVYGETGVLGLAALLAAFVVALISLLRGLATRDRDMGLTVAAAVSGVLAIIASGFALDSVDLPSVINVLWELASIGLVAAEMTRGPERLLRPLRSLGLAAVGAAAVGAVAMVTAPTQYAANYSFYTLSSFSQDGSNLVSAGDIFISTACQAITDRVQRLHSGLQVTSCRNPYTAEGLGLLRLQAPTAGDISAAIPELSSAARRAGLWTFALATEQAPTAGRPSGWVTLPASLPLFALIVAFAAPLHRRERSLRPLRPGWEPVAAAPPPLPPAPAMAGIPRPRAVD